MRVNLLYFAWLRTRIGVAGESVDLPADVTDVAGLIVWLRSRGEPYAQALANSAVVKVAVNQDYAAPDQALRDADEVALFPPVTGG